MGKRRKRSSNDLFSGGKTCDECSQCSCVGGGDHYCHVIDEIVLENYSPTRFYMGCRNKKRKDSTMLSGGYLW